MNTAAYLWECARQKRRRAMPILSFPAVQEMRMTIRELTQSSEHMAQAMQIVASRTPSAAAVSLMDLSVEAEAFGAKVRFTDDEIPTVIGQLVADEHEARDLSVPAVGAGRTGVCVEAIRKARERIHDRPVLAGCIGPFSLAGRLMDVTEIMYQCYDDPDTVHIVLEKAAEFLIDYCTALREAGADGVVMAEPLAGLLSASMNAEFSCTYVRRIIEAVQTGDFAVIYHNCGNTVVSLLPDLFSLHAAAYHFGNAVSMRDVLDKAPADVLCMGNIDPVSQFTEGTQDGMKEAVNALLLDCADAPNFLLSSGCDIPPNAKWENICAFFRAAEEFEKP